MKTGEIRSVKLATRKRQVRKANKAWASIPKTAEGFVAYKGFSIFGDKLPDSRCS